MFHISMNEGMLCPLDIDEFGKPSFIKTAIRGLWEELGIEVNPQTIEFLNFGALAYANEYGLLGRVKVPLTAAQVEREYHIRAKDRGLETHNEIYPVDYLPDLILEFVNSHSPWTPNGLATLYYAMVREWGYLETKRAFSRNPTKYQES